MVANELLALVISPLLGHGVYESKLWKGHLVCGS